MPARRRLAASLTAVAAVAGLSGCSKPTPMVTVVSGGHTTKAEATTYCFSGQDITKPPGSADGCRLDDKAVPAVLSITPGQQVSVDVDKRVADKGWYVVLKGGAQGDSRTEAMDGHYFAFPAGFTAGARGPLSIEVHSTTGTGEGVRETGVWQFQLVPR
jgi:Protein of unknown function (DUF2771)